MRHPPPQLAQRGRGTSLVLVRIAGSPPTHWRTGVQLKGKGSAKLKSESKGEQG
jgi:hypothetical protein